MHNYLLEILNLNKQLKKVFVIINDIFLIVISCLFTEIIIHLTFGPLPAAFIFYSVISIITTITILYISSFYRILSRHFSIKNVSFLICVLGLNIILLILISKTTSFYFPEIVIELRYFNLNFIIQQNITLILLIIFSRIIFLNLFEFTFKENKKFQTAIIYGSEIDEIEISKNIKFKSRFKFIGFLENDLNKVGRVVDNYKIFSFNDLKLIRKKIQISKCVIIKNKYDSNKLENIQLILKKLKIKIIFFDRPVLSDESSFLNFKIQSLKNFNPKYFENKTIMVTGAAGTIGKEICLQLEKTKAKKIIGVDINEYGISVFNLQNKYKSKNKIKLFLLDVSNLIAIKEIFELEKPSIIFHAAANKHVDIVEDNKNYSIYNNLKTIFNVLHLSSRYNFVKRLIFISTDKAVEPSNYMGLTKRVGEILINYFAKKYKKNFTSVRFGNVIGSSGSYIEILKKQIFNGGPITITDKRATRYFMTLNDAVNLVLQSCEEKFIGGVFVLNMGDPINIFNLTKEILKKNNLTIKDKKNLSGDLEVKIIGLKKGEKLFEKLYNSNSKVIKTKNNLIDYEYPEKVNLTKVNKILNYCKSEINDETFKRGNEIIDI